MNSKEIIKLLEKDGWKLVGIKGSHRQYKHPFKKGRVTVVSPSRDFAKGTLSSIFKQAGLDKKNINKH